MFKILVINLGGTSSKIALFHDTQLAFEETLRHTEEEMNRDPLSRDQLRFRTDLIRDMLKENQISMENVDAVSIRSATVPEAKYSGTYLLNSRYKELLLELYIPQEPLVNGIRIVTPLALELTQGYDIPIYLTDPPSVDEMQDVARISGIAGYRRRGRFHALNQRAVARKHAESLGKPYEDCRFVVAHLGGGISVGAHAGGKVIDVNDAGEGYGPFTPDRAGTVATEVMLDLMYGRNMTYEQAFRTVRGTAGIYSYCQTRDLRIVEERAEKGDTVAEDTFQAMAYQIAKEIGMYAAVLKGKIDAILLTGGISHSERMVATLTDYVENFAPVAVYPGEFENEALAMGAYRVLTGQEEPILL